MGDVMRWPLPQLTSAVFLAVLEAAGERGDDGCPSDLTGSVAFLVPLPSPTGYSGRAFSTFKDMAGNGME
jgi:hypothetical protein